MNDQQRVYVLRTDEIRARVCRLVMAVGKQSGKLAQITIAPYRKKRSLSQNALLHKWFDVIAKESDSGYSAHDIKELLCKQFLSVRVVEIGGISHECRAETSKLSTVDMSEFMGKIEAWAAELGILLPTPGEFQ